jgi:hypothetical protein
MPIATFRCAAPARYRRGRCIVERRRPGRPGQGREVGTIALRKGFFEKYNKNYLFRFSLPHSLRLQAGPASATLNRHGTRRVPSKRPALKRYILAQR